MCNLDITDLKIYPTKKQDSNVRALCIATFNDALVVSGLRIKEGKKGIYLAFPLQKSGDNVHPIVYPTSGEARKEISNRILATYVVNHCVDEDQE